MDRYIPFQNYIKNIQLGAKPSWGARGAGSLWSRLHCWAADL